MIPILYSGTETKFKTNGIGRLSDAITCTCTEERNGKYEVSMTYPNNGIHYSDIQYGNIIVVTHCAGGNHQPFEIYKIVKNMSGTTTISARHISYRLSCVPVMPFSLSVNAHNAFYNLKKYSVESMPFDFSTDITGNKTFTVEEPSSFRSWLGGKEGSILDIYGGEYEFDNWMIRLKKKRSGDKETFHIRYGKNLSSLQQEENIENTVTGIVPYWKGTDDNQKTVIVTLSEKKLESSNASKFAYKRTVAVDVTNLITLGDNVKKATEAQVRTAGKQYMSTHDIGAPKVSITVSFQDVIDYPESSEFYMMHNAQLCDYVQVDFSELGISKKSKIQSVTWNVLQNRYDSITIGEATSNFESVVATISEKQEE